MTLFISDDILKGILSDKPEHLFQVFSKSRNFKKMFLFQLFQKTAFIINSRKKHIKECQKKSKIGKKKLKLNSDNLRDH